MSEITITISNGEDKSAVLKAPSALPLPAVTASVQGALEECSASGKRQEEWAEDVAGNIAPSWDLDLLGKWGTLDGTVVFFPIAKVAEYDLSSVQDIIKGDRSVISIGDYKLQSWTEMTDFVKALSLGALIACYEKTMLVIRSSMDLKIGDDKYCPVPGIARKLWEKLKGYAK